MKRSEKMEAAIEHQIQADTLLDFIINIKEPERKKRSTREEFIWQKKWQ